MTIRVSIAQTVEKAITRNASERGPNRSESGVLTVCLSGSALRLRLTHSIAHAANGFYHVDAHLLAKPPDKDLDCVGIAVEILIVKMLDQFGPGHDLAHVVHQIGKQAE